MADMMTRPDPGDPVSLPSRDRIREPAQPNRNAHAGVPRYHARHWTFKVGVVLFTAIVLILLLTPWIAPYDPADQDLTNRLAGPSGEHWFGTDHLGRDVLSRLMWGGRFSMTIAAITLVICAVSGIIIGAVAARRGGAFDELVMRTVDVMICFPDVVVALFLIAIFGTGYGTLILALTITGWTPFARLMRGLALDINSKDFVEAAEILGSPRPTSCSGMSYRTPSGQCLPWPSCASGQADHRGRSLVLGAGRAAARLRLGRHVARRPAIHGAGTRAGHPARRCDLPRRAECDDDRPGPGPEEDPAQDCGNHRPHIGDNSRSGVDTPRGCPGGRRRMTRDNSGTPTRIPRATFASMVTERLRDSIVNGALQPGSQLSEVELANSFGVSRGPVREALQRLIQEGLLRSEPHRGGSSRCSPTRTSSTSIWRVRRWSVLQCAHLSATSRLATATGPWTNRSRPMEKAEAAEDWEAVGRLDLDFHAAIVASTESQRLKRMFSTVISETQLCLGALTVAEARHDLVAEHRRISDLVREGDTEQAVRALKQHFDTAVATLTSHLTTTTLGVEDAEETHDRSDNASGCLASGRPGMVAASYQRTARRLPGRARRAGHRRHGPDRRPR